MTPEFYAIPKEMLTESQLFWQENAGPGLYNGSLARLESWKMNGDTLELNLELTDYRTQFYSNHHVERILENWGEKSLSRAMGISTIVEIGDDQVLLMKRSRNVGEYPGMYDVFGGHVEFPGQNIAQPDVYGAMYAELEEELGVNCAPFRLELLGLIESIPNRKPELVFACRLPLTYEKVLEYALNARDRFEFDQIISVLYPFDGYEMSPSAAGCLSLFRLKHQEGQGGKRRS